MPPKAEASRKRKLATGSSAVFESRKVSVRQGGKFTPATHGSPDTIFFYGHAPHKPWKELSNFYITKAYTFTLPVFAHRPGWPTSFLCTTSEKSIMVIKAALMEDRESFDKLLVCNDPMACKKLGRQVKPWVEELWKKHIQEIAFEVVLQKFSSDPELRALLLSTGESGLAEASPRDRIWGIGIGEARARETLTWPGRNLLGEALMRARATLKERDLSGRK